MVASGLLLALALTLQAHPSVRLARIDRVGLPPYTAESGKVYILKGEGTARLKPGDRLAFRRPEFRLSLGVLVITRADGEQAEGTLAEPGESFPLKGDEAVLLSPGEPPPAPAPAAAAPAGPGPSPAAPARPAPPAKAGPSRAAQGKPPATKAELRPAPGAKPRPTQGAEPHPAPGAAAPVSAPAAPADPSMEVATEEVTVPPAPTPAADPPEAAVPPPAPPGAAAPRPDPPPQPEPAAGQEATPETLLASVTAGFDRDLVACRREAFLRGIQFYLAVPKLEDRTRAERAAFFAGMPTDRIARLFPKDPPGSESLRATAPIIGLELVAFGNPGKAREFLQRALEASRRARTADPGAAAAEAATAVLCAEGLGRIAMANHDPAGVESCARALAEALDDLIQPCRDPDLKRRLGEGRLTPFQAASRAVPE
jgi:hypothetical protein